MSCMRLLRARFSLRWIPGNATNDDVQELRRLQPPSCVVDLRQIATTGEREGKRGEAELETTGRDESRKCQYQVPPSKLREGKVPRRGLSLEYRRKQPRVSSSHSLSYREDLFVPMHPIRHKATRLRKVVT